MNNERPPLLLRFFPCLTDLIFLLPLVMLFGAGKGAHSLLSDGDTGWHIRTGEWIVQNGRVPDRDLFSFSMAGKPWFAWEWLWDAGMGWIHLRWRLAGVVLVNTLILCLAFVVVYRLARRKGGNDFLAVTVTGMALLISGLHWLARPHLTTFLFFAITYTLLERAREGNWRLLLVLPPLMVVWVNLHGGFVAGLLLIGLYAAGLGLSGFAEGGPRMGLRQAGPFLLAAAGCSAGTLLNPYGIKLHVHIYQYLTDSFYRQNIAEFQPVDFRRGGIVLFEILLLLGAFAAFDNLRRKRFLPAILYVSWGYLALTSARNLPLFGIICAPLVSETVQGWVRSLAKDGSLRRLAGLAASFENNAQEFSATDRISRLHLTSAAAILAVGALLAAPAPPASFRAEFDPQEFPSQALSALSGSIAGQRIFAPDLWGGYMIYRLYPRSEVFMDGRSDFYGPEFVRKYLDIVEIHPNWGQRLDEYGVAAILIAPDSPLATVLKETAGWRCAYRDGVAVLFQRVTRRASRG